jgi:hypothetical protein
MGGMTCRLQYGKLCSTEIPPGERLFGHSGIMRP